MEVEKAEGKWVGKLDENKIVDEEHYSRVKFKN